MFSNANQIEKTTIRRLNENFKFSADFPFHAIVKVTLTLTCSFEGALLRHVHDFSIRFERCLYFLVHSLK